MRFFLFFLFLFPAVSWADCVDPVGEEGQMVYNVTHKVMQFCNGTNWISMASTFASGAWTNNGAGDLYFDTGKVGIGTDTPSAPLHILSSVLPDMIIEETGSGSAAQLQFLNTLSSWQIGADSSPEGFFIATSSASGQDTFFINPDGDIGIGTGTPLAKLDVINPSDIGVRIQADVDVGIPSEGDDFEVASVDASGNVVSRLFRINSDGSVNIIQSIDAGENSPDDAASLYIGSRSGTHLEIDDNEIVAMSDASTEGGRLYLRDNVSVSGDLGVGGNANSYSLEVNGDVGATAFTETSDRRLKKNIHALSYGLTDVLKLRPVTFAWKKPQRESLKGTQVGLIAQEVEEIIPEVVNTAKDEMKTKSIQYTSLVPLLIKGMQEQQAEINALRARLDALDVGR